MFLFFLLLLFSQDVFAKNNSELVELSAQTIVLKKDLELNEKKVFLVVPGKEITLDGAGHSIFFPQNNHAFVSVGEGSCLIIKNTQLIGFNPSSVELSDGASFEVGDGSRVSLLDNLLLEKDSLGIVFSGNVELDLKGNLLDVASDKKIILKANTTLRVKNFFINHHVRNGLFFQSSDAKVILEKGTIFLNKADFVVGDNWWNIQGNVFFESFIPCCGTCPCPKIILYGDGGFIVNQESRLKIQGDVCLESFLPEKMKFSDDPQSKIVFQDSSSVLHLDSCVLSFQGVGHQLSQGILRISNKVGLVTQTEFDEPALTLDDSLGVHITPKSSLVLKGPLRYKKALEKLLSPA